MRNVELDYIVVDKKWWDSKVLAFCIRGWV